MCKYANVQICKCAMRIETFNKDNFTTICSRLTERDADLRRIIEEHGFPPMWTRPNTFQTLVLTILEQQVSLASAYAAFKKLRGYIGTVTPAKILRMTDEELRACYFSRQKISYVRILAEAFQSKKIQPKKLMSYSDDEIRAELKKLKGIGDWTVDVYLMHALQRTDLFPLGDIALVNSLKESKQLPATTSKEQMLEIAEPWRPFRTIASMILWHSYIKKRNIQITH